MTNVNQIICHLSKKSKATAKNKKRQKQQIVSMTRAFWEGDALARLFEGYLDRRTKGRRRACGRLGRHAGIQAAFDDITIFVFSRFKIPGNYILTYCTVQYNVQS